MSNNRVMCSFLVVRFVERKINVLDARFLKSSLEHLPKGFHSLLQESL